MNHSTELRDRVDELEARLDRLEDEGEGDAISPPTVGGGDGARGDVEPGAEVREALEASGWSKGRNREERQRNAAVAAWALEVLRDAERELRRSDIPVEALDDERKADTLWLEIIRPAVLAARDEGYVETDDSDQRYRWVGE